jgi:hypothetical protein
MSVEIERRGDDELILRFVVDDVAHFGVVSVVGSFNDWTPGIHQLVADNSGAGAVSIAVPYGEDVHFRYLASEGGWFDDPDADDIAPDGSVMYARPSSADRPTLGAPDASRGGASIDAAVANAEAGSQVEGVHTPSGQAEPGESRLEQMPEVFGTHGEPRVDTQPA